jgi:hypothetical protein
MGRLTPHATVIDACVLGSGTLPEDELILRIKEVVETFHERAKVYNLSMNAQRPIQQNRISLIAYEIDNLSRNLELYSQFRLATIKFGEHTSRWKIFLMMTFLSQHQRNRISR